jgi:hypothetical protein
MKACIFLSLIAAAAAKTVIWNGRSASLSESKNWKGELTQPTTLLPIEPAIAGAKSDEITTLSRTNSLQVPTLLRRTSRARPGECAAAEIF